MSLDFSLARRQGAAKKAVLSAVWAAFVLYSALILYPLFNMIVSSFKATGEIFNNPFGLPSTWRVEGYLKVWLQGGFGLYFVNSILVTALAMAVVLAFGSTAAYGLARYKFRLNTAVSLVFLGGIMLPLKAAIIPLYLLIRNLRLMDTHAALVLIFAGMGLPSTVFILAGFMRTVPRDLEHSARIDGCGEFGIYRQVIMPLAAPSLALVTIYNAVPIWNDFFFPLVFIQNNVRKTLPLGLSVFFGQYQTNWSLLFVGLTIAILPMILLYLFMSKYFIQGMTAGALK